MYKLIISIEEPLESITFMPQKRFELEAKGIIQEDNDLRYKTEPPYGRPHNKEPLSIPLTATDKKSELKSFNL